MVFTLSISNMAEKFLGSIISVDCGDVLGIYEGEVTNVDSNNQAITLINVCKKSTNTNEHFQVSEVTLRSEDITNLSIVRPVQHKPKSCTSIGQNQSSAFQQPNIIRKIENCNTERERFPSEEMSKPKGENKKKNSKQQERKRLKDKDSACFGATINSDVLETEFDFEKNLALFDKQAVFDEIDAHLKNDNVKLVDCNKRTPSKYRHDENILESLAPIYRQISVPCFSEMEYVTDSGLVIPSVTVDFKTQLLRKAQENGILPEVQIEMVGRAASEMVLQLLGGSHRLNPQNSHQKPTVIVLSCGHLQGAQAVNCGKHLANHKVNVTVLCPPQSEKMDKWFSRELGIFLLSGGTKTSTEMSLPTSVDLVVNSLEPHDTKISVVSQWLDAANQWIAQCKAPILYLDPAPDSCLQRPKWILCPALPFAFSDKNASIYICDIGLPKGIFKKAGMCYASPFGSKFVIPLYSKSV